MANFPWGLGYESMAIPPRKTKRRDDRVIRSIYTPKEIHYVITVAFQEFIRNEMSLSEELLLKEFANLLLGKFEDV